MSDIVNIINNKGTLAKWILCLTVHNFSQISDESN